MPDEDTSAYTPDTVPPDTDRFIYRPVTKFRNGDAVTELTQIAIIQP